MKDSTYENNAVYLNFYVELIGINWKWNEIKDIDAVPSIT